MYRVGNGGKRLDFTKRSSPANIGQTKVCSLQHTVGIDIDLELDAAGGSGNAQHTPQDLVKKGATIRLNLEVEPVEVVEPKDRAFGGAE